MAFSFSNTTSQMAAAPGMTEGPSLQEVSTEALGFKTLNGEAKLRLTQPWSPAPAANASLMSIAPRLGLVAAAGPDAVVIASTDTVRKSFESEKIGDDEIRPFEPQLKLPLPTRICQLAFTTDEKYLLLSAEQGGGLAVYEVDALQKGSTEPTFQIPTNGEPLRALVPNPNPEMGALCAVVTAKGKLLLANMKDRDFAPGQSGRILKEQVSCVAWSTKGKQLVAGLGDGILHQMTPNGEVKAEIPRPSGLDPNYYVSMLVWLENNVFMTFYVSTSEGAPQTKCYLITKEKQGVQYQELTDPVDAFGAETVPHHTAVRLKDFPPTLQDLLIFSSSAVADIGLVARSKTPLASDGPADVFTNVILADDSKRATLPMGDDLSSPPAVGVCLDLSSRDKVYKPLPSEESDWSPGPLPGYWVLTDQGVLSIWWIIYRDSLRSGTTYPPLATAESNGTDSATSAAPQPVQPNPFAGVNASANTSAFGGPSTIGSKSSPWGLQAASGSTGGASLGSSPFNSAAPSSGPKFGTPSFGVSTFGTNNSASAPAPAFGQASGPGVQASPWASGPAASNRPAFGQTGFGSNPAGPGGGVFGSSSASGAASSGGFAGFASQGGFGSLGSNANSDGSSIFASKSSAPEVSMNSETSTSFPPPSTKASMNHSGNPFGSQPFKLTSSFKPDPSAKDEENAKDDLGAGSGSSLFGSNFTTSMNEATKATSPNPFAKSSQSLFGQPTPTDVESTTPTTTPAPSKFFSQPSPAPTGSGIFGFPPKPSGSIFDTGSKTPKAAPPQVKVEPETPKLDNIPPGNTPLPPESTSKISYPLGDSSSSSATTADNLDLVKETPSKADDVPLPSDSPPPTPPTSKKTSSAAAPIDAPLPPDPVKNKSAYSAPLPDLPNVAKSKAVADAPLPPDPVSNKKAYAKPPPPLPGASSKPTPANDAPLPPDPAKQPQIYENKDPTLPLGKPPTSILSSSGIAPGFKFPSNPPPVSSDSDDDDLSEEDGDEEGTDAASEGSGVDVAKDLSPSTTGISKTPGFTPTSSFDGLAGGYSTITKPDQDKKNLFGDLGRNVPFFPQPNPLSPRSPSPVRGAVPTRVLGNDQSRSFSAPGMASQILGGSRRPQSRTGPSIVGRDSAIEHTLAEQQRKAKAKKEAEETQLLVDEEDDAVQQILNAQVEPTLTLDEFIAHSGVAPPAGDSVPAQVEAVYRDINSMIDTLGLNARSLNGFILGHKEYRADDRTKQDLADPDDWTLGEIEQLSSIIGQNLGEALADARVTDVEDKLAEIADLSRELTRDRNKQIDLRKIIASKLDPEQSIANKALPLSAEQAAQQSDLRREFAKFMKLVAETEENLTLLKAKIVSVNSANGKGGPTPTIEAVVRTISKMTSMVEKRSGDIDVLENQMRRLRLGSTGPTGSREASPFTPNAKRMSTAHLFSPERSTREGTPQRSVMRHSLSGSVGSLGGFARTPPRKKLSGFGDAEKGAVKEKRERRAAVLGKLRISLQKKGPCVVGVEDIE